MAWRHVLEEYVPRQLTEPSDKLLAITGIVSSYSATQDDACIAGHWKSSFPFNLLWHASAWTDDVRPSPVRRVPTWSWASQDGHLIILGELDRRYCAPIAKILNIEHRRQILEGNGALTLISPQLPPVRLQVADEGEIRWEFATVTERPLPSSPDPLGNNVETYFDIPDIANLTDPLIGAFISCGEAQASQPSVPSANRRKTLIRCEGLILRPHPSSQSSTLLTYSRVGHFKFGEILTGRSPSRFMPPNWRFHVDIEERNGRTFTKPPDFGDSQLMRTVEIV